MESPSCYLNMYPRLRFLASHASSANPGGIPAVEELQTLPRGRAHAPPASHEGISREEGCLDGQNIIARDVLRRIGALENDL